MVTMEYAGVIVILIFSILAILSVAYDINRKKRKDDENNKEG